MNYTIRRIRPEEIKLLDTFLYEAIFIPEGAEAPPEEIICQPNLQVRVIKNTGHLPSVEMMEKLLEELENLRKR